MAIEAQPSANRPLFLSASGLIFIGLSAILCYQVLLPLVLIAWTSLKTVRPGEAGFLAFDFTLANYARAYGIREFWEASLNTLYFALLSTGFSFAAGTFLAWTVERTNTPLRRLIGIVTLGRIIIPGVIITISWVLMAAPNIGVLNYLIESATGVPRLLNIYSFAGMIWVQALEMTPLAYLLMAAAMQSIDPRLEEASSIAGARRLANVSPGHAAAHFAGRGRGSVANIYPIRRELRGAAASRRARQSGGLHDPGLFQHLAHADGLGAVEHLFDGVVAAGAGSALCAFPGRPSW